MSYCGGEDLEIVLCMQIFILAAAVGTAAKELYCSGLQFCNSAIYWNEC